MSPYAFRQILHQNKAKKPTHCMSCPIMTRLKGIYHKSWIKLDFFKNYVQ